MTAHALGLGRQGVSHFFRHVPNLKSNHAFIMHAVSLASQEGLKPSINRFA